MMVARQELTKQPQTTSSALATAAAARRYTYNSQQQHQQTNNHNRSPASAAALETVQERHHIDNGISGNHVGRRGRIGSGTTGSSEDDDYTIQDSATFSAADTSVNASSLFNTTTRSANSTNSSSAASSATSTPAATTKSSPFKFRLGRRRKSDPPPNDNLIATSPSNSTTVSTSTSMSFSNSITSNSTSTTYNNNNSNNNNNNSNNNNNYTNNHNKTHRKRKKKKSKTELLDEFSTLMNQEFPDPDPKNTTLHIACLKHYSEELILHHLLRRGGAGTVAISKPNSNLDLPLHCAMMDGVNGGVSKNVVDRLISLYPRGIRSLNAKECFPIHLGCYYGGGSGGSRGGGSLYVIRRLLDDVENHESLMQKCRLVLPFDVKAREFIHKDSYSTVRKDDDGIEDLLVGRDIESPYHDGENFDQTKLNSCLWQLFASFAPSPQNSFEEASVSLDDNNNDNGDGDGNTTATTSTIPVSPPNNNTESEFTPLHLAVLSGAPPDIIELLLNTKPECIKIHTNQGRKAIDCAKYAVIHQLSSTMDDSTTLLDSTTKNIFAAIEILQTFERIQKKKDRLTSIISQRSFVLDKFSIRSSDVSPHNSRRPSLMSGQHKSDDASVGGGNANFNRNGGTNKSDDVDIGKMAAQFSKRLMSSLSFGLPLGLPNEFDNMELDEVPPGFTPPTKLAHLCVDNVLPIGFRRLRRAMLSSQAYFIINELQKKKLKYADIEQGPWDIHDDKIGCISNPDGIQCSDFIGAERKCQYLVPKTTLVKANMAYENITIVEYNDYCFAVKKVTSNPDVPFGKTFECHTLVTVTNLGLSSCRLVASVEARFKGKPPMIAWKIKNSMYSGVTDFFVAQGEVICEHAD